MLSSKRQIVLFFQISGCRTKVALFSTVSLSVTLQHNNPTKPSANAAFQQIIPSNQSRHKPNRLPIPVSQSYSSIAGPWRAPALIPFKMQPPCWRPLERRCAFPHLAFRTTRTIIRPSCRSVITAEKENRCMYLLPKQKKKSFTL